MRVVVTGSAGMLGRATVAAFGDCDVAPLDRAALDVTDAAAVRARLAAIRPEVVVNCAAYTDVDAAEAAADRAHEVNALGPGRIAAACAGLGARLLHVSTDYVFSGPAPVDDDGAPRGWEERDEPRPVSVYGSTKLAGERLAAQALPATHVVRTAWLHGTGGVGFIDAVLRKAESGQELAVVDDQVGSPTAAADLATALRELAEDDRFGTWHRAGRGRCSWHELAEAAVARAGLDVEVARMAGSSLERPAPRPAWSVLDDAKATAAGLSPLPRWRDAVARLVDERAAGGRA